MKIITYNEKYKEEIISLILNIQNQEAGINLSLHEQPDLNDVQTFYLDDGGCFWVALSKQNEVIGTIGLMNKKNGYGILKKFFVRSDYRNKKVGFNLYQVLMAFCRSNKFHVLILDTPSVAKISHKFYEKNGFIRIEKKDLPISYNFSDRNSYLYLKRF